MNGKMKVERHTLEDGMVVIRVNGHIIPNVERLCYEALDNDDFPTITLTLRDVEFVETDDRRKVAFDYSDPDHRRLVQEALDDGRIIEWQVANNPNEPWSEAHKSYWGEYLDWDNYNFRLKGAKK